MKELEKTIDEIFRTAFNNYSEDVEYHLEKDWEEARTALLTAFNKELVGARIDELERLYLVYGSKEKPASLDNIFSLGKKGEVCATPIKNRLDQLNSLQSGGNNSVDKEEL